MRLLKAMMLSAVFFLNLFSSHAASTAATKTAIELTARCAFSASLSEDGLDKLHDRKHETTWTSSKPDGQYVQINLPEGTPAAGVYIMWNSVPENWTLLESSGGFVWSIVDLSGKSSFINTYVPLSGHTAEIRIESDSYKWKMSIAEIRVFGAGALPSDVQVWQAPPAKADLMVIPAHPDDELIYFGGTLPYYAGQLGKHTVVVYMTSSPIIRKFEALDGLWKVGVHEYPVFLPLANKYTSTVKDAEDAWNGLDNTVGLLVEQMRRFKPDVVVTHDLNGEYGHGAHKLTALAVEKAVDEAFDHNKYSGSASRYGIWQVKKCYLHLYSKKQIRMNWEIPLPKFNDRTALDMSKEGYDLHVSQHFRERPILDSGEYDNSEFGLYYSCVGPDTIGGDFFENIVSQPAQTPDPTPTMTQTPASTKASAKPQPAVPGNEAIPSSGQKTVMSGNTKMFIIIAVVCALLIAAAILEILDKRKMMSARHTRKK